MTPEQQRIAIATYIGWTEIKHNPATDLYYGTPPKDHKPIWDVLLPNYLSDLNAMHDAIKQTIIPNDKHRRQFGFHLEKLYGPLAMLAEIVNSDADKLAKAFLLTLNLWKEN